MKKLVKFLLFSAILATSVSASTWAQVASYTLRIRNHLPKDASDLHLQLTNWFLEEGSTIQSTNNNGSTLRNNLWKRGEPFKGKYTYQRDEFQGYGSTDYDLGGVSQIKSNTIAEFKLTFTKPKNFKYAGHLLKGYYWWTDGSGKSLGNTKSINSRFYPNWDIESYFLSVSPKPGEKVAMLGCMLGLVDSANFTVQALLKKKEEVIQLGFFEGELNRDDSTKLPFSFYPGEPGDSIITHWNLLDHHGKPISQTTLSLKILQGTIFSPADSVFWSDGEDSISFITALGGPGVEVRCEQMPDEPITDIPDEAYFRSYFGLPPVVKIQKDTKLKFIRTGRRDPVMTGSNSGVTEDTVSFIVRHGDYRPHATWMSGDGFIEESNPVVTFPVTVTRQDPDDDWVYCEFLSDQLTDTIWFHKEISGTSTSFELPVEFPAGFLSQVDSLQLIITALFAPSSSDTLTIYVSHSQGIDLDLPKPLQVSCYPNPVQDEVFFDFNLTEPGPVELVILDLGGRELEVWLNESLPAGKQHLVRSVMALPQGVYFYRLSAGRQRMTGKFSK